MKLTPYLNFDGNCAEAMAFYAELFGGKVVYQLTYAEMNRPGFLGDLTF